MHIFIKYNIFYRIMVLLNLTTVVTQDRKKEWARETYGCECVLYGCIKIFKYFCFRFVFCKCLKEKCMTLSTIMIMDIE